MIGNTNTSSPNNAIKVLVKEETFTQNGNYNPPAGYFGFAPIHINVDTNIAIIAAYAFPEYSELTIGQKVIINPNEDNSEILQNWIIKEAIRDNFITESLIGYVNSIAYIDSNNNTYYNIKTLLNSNE